jgi:hypothetical protein
MTNTQPAISVVAGLLTAARSVALTAAAVALTAAVAGCGATFTPPAVAAESAGAARANEGGAQDSGDDVDNESVDDSAENIVEDGPGFEGEEETDVSEEVGLGDEEIGESEDGVSEDGVTEESVSDDDVPEGDDAQALAGATCGSTAHVGDYCGGDKNNGNPSTLYRCNGPGPATVIRSCANGCHVAPPGEDDYCNAPPPPSCDSNASVGYYCGGDKVSNGNANKLYFCDGPGPATVEESCTESCVVAPAGQDDYCENSDQCPHMGQLKWGLAPAQSDHMRCAGITAAGISQTIGNAAASAGTHAQDGTSGGFAYCAATDLRTAGLTNAQVKTLLNKLANEGFAAFFRNPGHDGWPSSEVRHIHAIYVGVPMKSALRAQVRDWLNGKNGLASHTTYSFWQASGAQKNQIEALFEAHN